MSFPSGSSRSPRRGPGTPSRRSRAQRVARRRALAVRAVEANLVCSQRVARAATRDVAVVQACSRTTRRKRGARYNYLPEALVALLWRQSGRKAFGWLHAAVARISRKSPLYGVPRDGSRGAPARGAAVPRRERARFATWLFGRRGPTHPSSPTPPGPRAVAQIRARNLTSHRSSLRRPKGAASYAPNLSLHTPPLRAGTHDCTTHRCCNGRQPQTIPAPEIQHAQAAVAARARGARGGARRASTRCVARDARADAARRLATTARRRAAFIGHAARRLSSADRQRRF